MQYIHNYYDFIAYEDDTPNVVSSNNVAIFNNKRTMV